MVERLVLESVPLICTDDEYLAFSDSNELARDLDFLSSNVFRSPASLGHPVVTQKDLATRHAAINCNPQNTRQVADPT
jgi:hypothetical protein